MKLPLALTLSLLLGACVENAPESPPDQAILDAIVFEAQDGNLYVDAVELDRAFQTGNVEREIVAASRLDMDESQKLILAMYLNEYGSSRMLEALAGWACRKNVDDLADLNSYISGYTDYTYDCPRPTAP